MSGNLSARGLASYSICRSFVENKSSEYMQMIIYGTEIISDICFPQDFSLGTAARYTIKLSSKVPAKRKSAITCGFPFYQAHGRHVYLYSNRDLETSEKGQPWCYEVKDVVRFYWAGGERPSSMSWLNKGTKICLVSGSSICCCRSFLRWKACMIFCMPVQWKWLVNQSSLLPRPWAVNLP